MTTPALEIPGYVAGKWKADTVHSHIGFLVRHMMVSKVRGRFTSFEVEIVTAENPLDSSATLSVDLSSIDTDNDMRDNHIRSADFFDIENQPKMTYRTTGIRHDGEGFVVDGDLTIRGVTRSVPL
ncbi:MAG TPA: YceI family protein, partial [Candidatus Dormibacteraeota bacterium]